MDTAVSLMVVIVVNGPVLEILGLQKLLRNENLMLLKLVRYLIYRFIMLSGTTLDLTDRSGQDKIKVSHTQ